VAFAAALVCVAVVVLIGVRVHGVGTPIRIDVDVDRRLPGLSPRLAARLMSLGTGSKFALAIVVLVGGALALRDRYSAVVAGLAGPLAEVLTEWIGKPLVARTEPLGIGYPSGHVTGVAVIGGLVVLIGYRRWRWWGLAVLGPVAIAMTAYMTLAVVSLHFHYFTDTVGGALVGYGTVAAVASLVPLDADRALVGHRRNGSKGRAGNRSE
jgi:membrane-associated phospholipid phosphatase